MRLIDADVLTEIIENTDWYHVGKCGLARGANSKNDIPLYKAEDIHKAIDNTPTVEVSREIFEWIDSNAVNLNFLTGNFEINFGMYLDFKKRYKEKEKNEEETE